MRTMWFLLIGCAVSMTAYGYEESYEIPDETEVISRTCRLSVQLKAIPDKTLEKPTGRARITVNLFDDDGNPYRGERVELSATHGTFICRLPDDSLSEESETSTSCFTTGDDGLATIYLVNIPLNTKIQVKASYLCGEQRISSSASLGISRGKVRRRKAVNPHR